MLTKIEASLAGMTGALTVLIVWTLIQWLWSRRAGPDRSEPIQPSDSRGPHETTSVQEEADVPICLRRPLSSHPRGTAEERGITRKHRSASRPSTDPNERQRHPHEAETSPTRARSSAEDLEERATLMFMPAVTDDPKRGPIRKAHARGERGKAWEGHGP